MEQKHCGVYNKLIRKCKKMKKLNLLNKRGDLFTRVSNLLNEIATIPNIDDAEVEKNLPWDEINTYLSFRDEYDYNLFNGRITSIRDLKGLQNDMKMAFCGMGPWYKGTCKDCNKTFFLTRAQVDEFVAKEWHLPKKCPKCQKLNRKKRQNSYRRYED